MSDPLGGLGAPTEPPPDEPRAAWQRPRLELPPRPPPVSTVALLGVLIAFFGVELWLDPHGPQGAGTGTQMLLRMGAIYAPAIADGDWWRLGSYAFLHIGPVHLLFNGYALWVLMREIEWTYGSSAALGIFAASALAGGAASFAAQHSAGTLGISAGASGGIFGLMGASGALLFRLRDRVPPEARRMLWRQFAFNIAINAGIAFIAHVDSYAHAGGFAAGAILGLVAPLPISDRQPWHLPVTLFLLCSALGLAACEGAAVARAVNPHSRLLEGRGAQAQVPWMLAPVSEGVAASPWGLALRAGIMANADGPGEDAGRAVQIGDRSFRLLQGDSGDAQCGEAISLTSVDDRMEVSMCCAAEWCKGAAGERLAEQIASTLRAR